MWSTFIFHSFRFLFCHVSISFEIRVPGEFELIKKIMARDKVDSIYSSGRKCNFKGCEGGEYLFKVSSFSIGCYLFFLYMFFFLSFCICCFLFFLYLLLFFLFVFVFVIGDHLQPINVNGWFWPGEDSLLESLKKRFEIWRKKTLKSW